MTRTQALACIEYSIGEIRRTSTMTTREAIAEAAPRILLALDGAVVLDQEVGAMKARVTASAGIFPKG